MQRLRSECILRGGVGPPPPVRQESVQALEIPAGRELAEDIREVGHRRHVILGAGSQQAVEVGGASRRIVGACEKVVLPTQGDIAKLLLDVAMPRPGLCRVGGARAANLV